MLTSSHWAKIGDTTVATRESFLEFKEFPGSLTYHTHVEDSKFINARRSRSRCDVISGSGAQLGRLLTVPWWWSSNFSASSFPCCWIFLNGVTLGQFEYIYIWYMYMYIFVCIYIIYIYIYVYMYTKTTGYPKTMRATKYHYPISLYWVLVGWNMLKRFPNPMRSHNPLQ